jgi:hypothetical protein
MRPLSDTIGFFMINHLYLDNGETKFAENNLKITN